jgi:hypothetical protein
MLKSIIIFLTLNQSMIILIILSITNTIDTDKKFSHLIIKSLLEFRISLILNVVIANVSACLNEVDRIITGMTYFT